MGQAWHVALWILASFFCPIALSALIRAVSSPSVSHPLVAHLATTDEPSIECQTLIADPNPPLNVRSSPMVLPDNKVASLPNGTRLSIVNEQEGWLQISDPLQGWVYKELTVTTCTRPNEPTTALLPLSTAAIEKDHRLLAIATEQYQSGKLDGAIALAATVPAHSAAYDSARLLIRQWQHDWQHAEAKYYTAQRALHDRRWQDVLSQINGYPAIRYWREKLAIIVRQAIEQDQLSSETP